MKVRQIRLDKHLSVPELSRLSNLPIRTIEAVEKRNECTIATAMKLAKALRVTLDELCDFKAED